jgi:hypothetical protein
MALGGAMLTFVGVGAQQRASDETKFRKLIDDYCAASPRQVLRPGPQSDFLRHRSVPVSRLEGIPRRRAEEFFANMSVGSLTAGKDLKITRRGAFARGTVSMHFTDKTKDGKTTETEIHYTGIWEKRGPLWLIVHEHLSAPMS